MQREACAVVISVHWSSPFFLPQQEILNQLSSISKTSTHHNSGENREPDYRETPQGAPPRWRAVVQMQLWYTAVADTARRVTPPLNQALEVALLKKLLVCLYEACRAWTLCRLLKCGAISRNIIDSFFSLQIFKWEAHYGIVFKSWEQVCNSPMCSTGFVPFSVLGQWATYSPKLR